VTDISVDGMPLDEKTEFNKLICEDRIEHIIKTINEYGCDSDVVRGLIFCSRIEEARQLSDSFNTRGFQTLPITGSDSENAREEAIRRLESDEEDKLDYLFTVDVFNEGVDIPQVNQVVMLRPTTSAIIFVQQLGRGLRKADGKDYVTVIDFIGNYQNNYLIPLALFGDSSYNKDKLRRLLGAGSSLIPGASSISFEKIARERIFASIDSANLNTKKALTEDFELLKFRLGRTPMMMDFIENNSRDPYQYIDYSESMLAFTKSLDPELSVDSTLLRLLECLSKHVCDGVRLEESVILEGILTESSIDFDYIKRRIMELANYQTDENTIESAIHSLNLNYATERRNKEDMRISEASGFKLIKRNQATNELERDMTLIDQLHNQLAFDYLLDLAKASTQKFLSNFDRDNYIDGFKRGAKYTRNSVHRILKWDKKPNHQNVGGYKVSPDNSNCPVFVTYKKGESISDTTKYEDRFINPSHLIYMSKNRRNLHSPDVKAMRNHVALKMRMPFFLKKSDDEGQDYYYLGELTALEQKFENTTMPNEDGQDISVVKMEYLLDREIDFRLYNYITEA